MSPLWDWSSDHIWRPNREEEQAELRSWLAWREMGVDEPEGRWLVEIRDWDRPTQWVTKVVTVERSASGWLGISEDNGHFHFMRHHRDVRKWIRKVEGSGS